ncbi:uncharacterized protein PV09_05476 [Verruconis gallopava]|uniref:Mid2 domain-containing protein n=1 Tax=Verruconis gallopava TaxID=253628 RepID=A0A0D2A9H9_9PEZI|nr:uncharacterized protein PV09_05476 [Verruconis gallopava]KIW03255.1 hypothetical protein PV09_05476 [Verruconis gallopava]
MRFLETSPAITSFVALLLTSAYPTAAGPFSRVNEVVRQEVESLSYDDALSLQNSTLELKRRQNAATCSSSQFNCGYYGQVCCESGTEVCGTNSAGEAVCVAASSGSQTTAVAGSGGQWQVYTSIWTTTGAITMTSIYSSYIPAVTSSSSGNCVPNWANDESACGKICCSSGQYCFDETNGICKPAGNGGYTTTGVTNSPPTRATTSNGVIITLTMTPTTTVPFSTPIATGQNATIVSSSASNGGLSGGAIAGIVIGVLAGVALLILLCLCCCLKAGFDGILALFGLGKKKDRRRRVVEEEYVDVHRRYGSQAGSGRRWYGSAASGRPSRPPPPKKSGIANLATIGLSLGGLAAALGLRRELRRRQEEKSDISSSYYDSYYYSSSSVSGSRRAGSRR